jgi:hypothetical protein
MERREESARLEPVFRFLERVGDVVLGSTQWVSFFAWGLDANLGARLWPSAMLCCELATRREA